MEKKYIRVQFNEKYKLQGWPLTPEFYSPAWRVTWKHWLAKKWPNSPAHWLTKSISGHPKLPIVHIYSHPRRFDESIGFCKKSLVMLLEVLTFCKFIYLSRRSQIRFLHRQNGCAIRSFHSADKCFHLLRVAIISRALIGQNGHECAINVYTNVLRHTSKLLWFRRKRFAYNLGPIKTREYETRYK